MFRVYLFIIVLLLGFLFYNYYSFSQKLQNCYKEKFKLQETLSKIRETENQALNNYTIKLQEYQKIINKQSKEIKRLKDFTVNKTDNECEDLKDALLNVSNIFDNISK